MTIDGKMLAEAAKQTWRGCGTLPHVGDHPGTIILAGLVVLGAAAGGVLGVVVMLALFGPMYLHGAWARSRDSAALTALLPTPTKQGAGG